MLQVPRASPGSSADSALTRNPLKGRSLLKATRRYWFGNKVSLSNEMFAGRGEEAKVEEEEEVEEEEKKEEEEGK